MRSGHCRPVLQFTAVVLCAAVAVGAWAAQARGQEPGGQRAGATSTVPPFIDVRLGQTLPDWPLEDGRGRRFRVSETRGRTQVLTLGLAFQRWERSVRAIQAIAGHRDRAAVLHLAAVPSTLVDDPLPDTPLVPARDGAQQH